MDDTKALFYQLVFGTAIFNNIQTLQFKAPLTSTFLLPPIIITTASSVNRIKLGFRSNNRYLNILDSSETLTLTVDREKPICRLCFDLAFEDDHADGISQDKRGFCSPLSSVSPPGSFELFKPNKDS